MDNNLNHCIEAGELTVEISLLPDGISLSKIKDNKKEYVFLKTEHALEIPLFTLTARKVESDELLTISSDRDWNTVSAFENSGVHTFVLADHKELPEVKIILTAIPLAQPKTR